MSYAADVVSSIKSKLNLNKLITVSPADLTYLTKDFLAEVDYINMQSYAKVVIDNWSLNSGNYFAEQAAQEYLYDKVQENNKILE